MRGSQYGSANNDNMLEHSDAGGEQWIQASDGLHPGEVLRHVGPVAVYGPFLEWLVSGVQQLFVGMVFMPIPLRKYVRARFR